MRKEWEMVCVISPKFKLNQDGSGHYPFCRNGDDKRGSESFLVISNRNIPLSCVGMFLTSFHCYNT